MLRLDSVVNSVFSSVTWLLTEEGSNRVWLVDCGDFLPILNILGGRMISGVLLTHAHFDHIYGLPELICRFPDCTVYTNEDGKNTLADARLNLSFYHETPLTIDGPQICVCTEGDVIQLFDNVSAKVYETPGHHPSCLTFEVGEYLFTGDAYIPGIKVVTNLPKSDKYLALKSRETISKLANGKIILSGHKHAEDY